MIRSPIRSAARAVAHTSLRTRSTETADDRAVTLPVRRPLPVSVPFPTAETVA